MVTKALASLLVLLALASGLGWAYVSADEARIAQVHVGQSIVEVERILGPASFKVPKSHFGPTFGPSAACRASDLEVAHVYRRNVFQRSLVVLVDSRGQVACLARRRIGLAAV